MQRTNYQTVLLALATGILLGERVTPKRGRRGKTGAPGPQGRQGVPGVPGPMGAPGNDGPRMSFRPSPFGDASAQE